MCGADEHEKKKVNRNIIAISDSRTETSHFYFLRLDDKKCLKETNKKDH